ncbi:hypothetical protein [Allorhodopirellula heiligendammensis]|uniref:hypothetical protein n=1 Tax=Allorhodopirellula heiligendammensis TaxID=2714739 RepID=UPI00265EDB58|nr:hypothetical protein [Allorhodopirellula heiligendammensis]
MVAILEVVESLAAARISPPLRDQAGLKTRVDETPSMPCGASSDARAATTNASPAGHEAAHALRGINQRLPCGALTNACSARHCPTPDQLVNVTQSSCRTEVEGKPAGTTLQ